MKTKTNKIGRKPQSYSFSAIPMSEIQTKLSGSPSALVLCSTKWLNSVGLTGQTGSATSLLAATAPAVIAPPVAETQTA